MNQTFLNADSFNFSMLRRLIVRYMVEILRKKIDESNVFKC